ncbi:MAG TPA: cyanophycin synthetase [Azospirillaceae bacterium]|nr:cyanophycin synthetase [Azospirillaceae bacterium]
MTIVSGQTPENPTEPVQVLEISVYRGPHIYGHRPMVRLRLDMGALAGQSLDRLPDVAGRLLAVLPGLRRHGRAKPTGGHRLAKDAPLAEAVARVAVEMQAMAGAEVSHAEARPVEGRPGLFDVLFEYRDEPVGLQAGRFALELVDALLPPALAGARGLYRIAPSLEELAGTGDDGAEPPPFDAGVALEELRRLHAREGLGPTTLSLVREAERRGIPVMRLDAESLVQLGWGSRQQRIRASITGRTSHLAAEAASDKDLTKSLLEEAGVPVPRGEVVRGPEAAVRAAERLGWPVVTKPLDGNHGRGVSLDLTTPDQVRRGFEMAERHGRRVIVEQFYRGRDHRILVVGGRIVAVAERVPAHVVGDGARTVRALVEEVNRDPRRGEGHEKVMTRIVIDDHVLDMLERAGMTPDSVPAAGEVVYLRATANLSTGGTAVDRTDDIHPENALIARRAALAVGLDVAGIDLIAPDITRSVRETGGGVVEVNAAPGFRMHLEPSQGRPRDVAGAVLDLLFPDGAPGRIPVFAVTGTNGKSTTCRMAGHILRQAGHTVGIASTTGVYVDEQRVGKWDASGPRSARMVLRDPLVDAAVLETARGGILREGLGFDACDVGVIINVEADHLGLRGIDTVEELARVKGVVAEAVRPGGHSVLNADDPVTMSIAPRAGGTLVLFSLDGADMAPHLAEHVAGGGMAAVREPGPDGGTLVLYRGGQRLELMRAADIPATLDGVAEFNIQNALAAAAACFAHGIPPQVIRQGLSTFTTSFEQCPGRLNIRDANGFRIILDYAHNPAGLKALGKALQAMRPRFNRIIGMVNIPGDRRDEDMREMGAIATQFFDEIVFREDPARRGRKPGEIVAHLLEGALEAGFSPERIRCALEEDEAARICLETARPGDLVVLTPTCVEDMWKQVLAFAPDVPPIPTKQPRLRKCAE